jgi:hypothetical protein
MAFLSLLQVFVPYAPAEILVPAADRERATAILRHLLLGEEAPQHGDDKPGAPAPAEWSYGRRTVFLALCLGGVGLLALALKWPRHEDGPEVPPAKLEVVRVDDTVDPLGDVPDSAIPPGAGIRIDREFVPQGAGRHEEVHFARIAIQGGESKKAAAVRLQRFLDTVAVPAGTRFGLEELRDFDPETNDAALIGLRSYLLTGPPALRTEDVVDATVAMNEMNGVPEPYVAVTLSDDGAKRFEEVTGEWTQRRLAILVDDEINSAPVVKTAITGGRLSITMGTGDPEGQLVQAKRLERALRHH